MAQPLTIEILERLIGFDTTSCNSNLALMKYVQSYLEDHGVASQLISDQEEKKANLYATIGPEEKAGVMLSGHTDTVSVKGQNWSKPPYQLSEQEGRYYGRGTSDMKGFLAVVLASVPELVDKILHTPIHLAFSYDEEIGCVGVRRLIQTMQDHTIKPAICIVGEPTSMKVVTAHKGKLSARVTVHGKECHSGMAPLGVNAVNYAARLIVWLENLAQTKQLNGPFDDSYETPYSTVHTGTVQGGTALNIVPNHCGFQFEIRNIAEEDPRDLLDQFSAYADSFAVEMQAIDSSCNITIEITSDYPGLSTADDADVVAFVRNLSQSTADAKISFGTEGGLFSNILGIATVVCGPGSMDQGHKPDEFIHAKQLEACETFMARLSNELSA
ncbi:MAG: acetylornithine deacetylase [Gammaproteobacteria bacterium]|jgi:acetylornithine deacetylase